MFTDDADRQVYLDRLRMCAREHKLDILAYCLMDNHIHLVVVPRAEDSLSMALRRTHSFYSRYLNAKTGRAGHVWQNRFYSCPIEKEMVSQVVKYVEQNPVRVGVVKRAEKFDWCSAPARCGIKESAVLSSADGIGAPPGDWANWLKDPISDLDYQAIRRATSRGQALGGKAFIARLEKKLNRPVGPRRIGRPPKTGPSTTKASPPKVAKETGLAPPSPELDGASKQLAKKKIPS